MAPPFGLLKYLYVGSSDFERDLAYYRDALRAELVWNFEGFGAHVAALRLGEGPLILVADHRPAGTCMLLFIVEDLGRTVRDLEKRGWTKTAGPFGIPDGSCYTFVDPSGNPYGIFQNERPDALVAEYDREQASKAPRAPSPPRRRGHRPRWITKSHI